MAQQAYTYLTWRGRIAQSAQCLSCLRADGGHDDDCGAPAYRDFTPTEQAELAWLNDRLDAITAERTTSGVEDLHWQEHTSICRSLTALVQGAQVGADVVAALNALRVLTGEQRRALLDAAERKALMAQQSSTNDRPDYRNGNVPICGACDHRAFSHFLPGGCTECPLDAEPCRREATDIGAALPCDDYRPHSDLSGLDGTALCRCGFERRQHAGRS